MHAGQPPTSVFTGYYAEAGALDVLGSADRLPPVLSGHNAYWMWGPGRASDRTVLVVDALGQLRPYSASCGLLTTYYELTSAQRLDQYSDRRLHRPHGHLAHAVAAPEALRLTRSLAHESQHPDRCRRRGDRRRERLLSSGPARGGRGRHRGAGRRGRLPAPGRASSAPGPARTATRLPPGRGRRPVQDHPELIAHARRRRRGRDPVPAGGSALPGLPGRGTRRDRSTRGRGRSYRMSLLEIEAHVRSQVPDYPEIGEISVLPPGGPRGAVPATGGRAERGVDRRGSPDRRPGDPRQPAPGGDAPRCQAGDRDLLRSPGAGSASPASSK